MDKKQIQGIIDRWNYKPKCSYDGKFLFINGFPILLSYETDIKTDVTTLIIKDLSMANDVLDLVTEVQRLNTLVDAACAEIGNDGEFCPPKEFQPEKHVNCGACWRRYLESEAADNG